jgi:hypothetical protein
MKNNIGYIFISLLMFSWCIFDVFFGETIFIGKYTGIYYYEKFVDPVFYWLLVIVKGCLALMIFLIALNKNQKK